MVLRDGAGDRAQFRQGSMRDGRAGCQRAARRASRDRLPCAYRQLASAPSTRPSQLLSIRSEQVGAPGGPSLAAGLIEAARSLQSAGSEVRIRIWSTNSVSSALPLVRLVSCARTVIVPLVRRGRAKYCARL